MNDFSDSSVRKLEVGVRAGDTNSYKDLRAVYMERPINEFLFWSLLMANKYNYPPAYYDVYYVLVMSQKEDLYAVDSLDQKTKAIALEYLKFAAAKKEENALTILDSLKNRIVH